jgi:hypothetical protein
MSKEQSNVAVNLYGILDNELQRMHDLLKVYMTLPKDEMRYTHINSSTYMPQTSSISEIYKRILEIQSTLLENVITSDRSIQDKIAELALTGKEDSNGL